MMVELADRTLTDAAWKTKNLEDYDRRLERAARRVDELAREHETAALVIYEAALMKSGRPAEEVRETVRRFGDTWQDEEESLTIPRVSGIMNVEGGEWFFGDDGLRVMAGQLLGQFQHRVAQYNYVDEREVLKRWADSYDTRLFIRRRIYETEPVVGVVSGFDFPLVQYLRVAAGGNTVVPSEDLARALETLGFPEGGDEYEILARAESLALHLDLPAPIVGALLEDIARDGLTDFPEPPEPTSEEDNGEESPGETPSGETAKPAPEDRAARRTAREDPRKGEEPTRVQDPQASDAPGVRQEAGDKSEPVSPETGREGAPGKEGDEDEG
ncbi:MAG: hypothetical protein ACR2HO_06545 [Rubrobacteraceae bacterium]|nr:hypothetical protein [Rubrobacter sp.]